MTTCYFIHFAHVTDREEVILSEIESLNPDLIFGLCLEEYDYHYIFGKMMNIIQPYLKSNQKTMKLIAPFVSENPVPDNIIVEDSYGYYHWSVNTVKDCINNNQRFTFTENSKLFTNYNNNSKYQRAMLVDTLAKYDLIKDGIVTLVNPKAPNPFNGFLPYEYQYHDGSVLLDEQDFKLNSRIEYSPCEYPRSYFNGCIDIVSESTYNRGEYFVTEKTAKPIGALKPFMIFGAPNMNKFIADKFSLELYDEFFDYSFDSEEDLNKRIEGIVQNLVRLRQLSRDELIAKYNSIEDKLINNRLAYIKIRDSLGFIPESLKFLQNNSDVKLYGSTDASILGEMGIIK